jgi:hypothetical protein
VRREVYDYSSQAQLTCAQYRWYFSKVVFGKTEQARPQLIKFIICGYLAKSFSSNSVSIDGDQLSCTNM